MFAPSIGNHLPSQTNRYRSFIIFLQLHSQLLIPFLLFFRKRFLASIINGTGYKINHFTFHHILCRYVRRANDRSKMQSIAFLSGFRQLDQ